MKKYLLLGLILILLIGGIVLLLNLKNQDKIVDIEGYAEGSKAGLVVDGIMLIEIEPGSEKYNTYLGKYVKVRGLVMENHPWKPKNENGAISQGFDMPVMSKIESISEFRK